MNLHAIKNHAIAQEDYALFCLASIAESLHGLNLAGLTTRVEKLESYIEGVDEALDLLNTMVELKGKEHDTNR